MKKNIFISTLSIILLLIVVIFSFLYFTYSRSYSVLLEQELYALDEDLQKGFKNYEIVNCKFNYLNPEHAFVNFSNYEYEDGSELKFLRVDFYHLNRSSIFSANWSINYTGGTTIRNTTYENLLKMVKQDCSQFQEDYKNPDPNGINWGYREAPTEEEIKQEEIREKESMIRGTRREMAEDFTQEGIDFLKNEHGYRDDFTDDELYEWVMNFRTLGVDLTSYLIPQEPTSNEDPFKDIVL